MRGGRDTREEVGLPERGRVDAGPLRKGRVRGAA